MLNISRRAFASLATALTSIGLLGESPMARPATVAVRLLAGSREPVRIATIANITLSSLHTVDVVALAVGDGVLVRDQTDATRNGINIPSAGEWNRASDANLPPSLNTGVSVGAQSGSIGAGRIYVFRTLSPSLGDDYNEITFSASEDLLARARDAVDAAIGAPVVADFATKSAAELAEIPGPKMFARLAGHGSAGDWGASLYRRANSEPSHEGKFQSADGTWWELAEPIVTPFMFGAVGDTNGSTGNGTDDTEAVQACFDYVEEKGGIAKLTGGSFRIADTVRARNIDVDFDGGILYYDGSRDRVALEIGDAAGGVGVQRKHIERIYVRSTAIDWTEDEYVGVRFTNFRRSFTSITMVFGFTRNVELYAYGSFCSYNSFDIDGGELVDSKYQLTLTCDGAGGGGDFCNENIFYGGRYANTSFASALGDAYGVHFRSLNSGYTGHNNNKWYGACFELQDGQPGEEREPFRFENCGVYNHGRDLRMEGGQGYFGQCIGTTTEVSNNNFHLGYAANGPVGRFLETGLARLNNVRTNWHNLETNTSLTFDFCQLVSAYSAIAAAVRGGLVALTSGSAEGALFQTSITGRKNSIRIGTNRGIGFFVACEGGETSKLASQCEVGFTGRFGIALYDANGDRLTNVSPDAPHISGFTPTWSDSYGGYYTPNGDGANLNFTVSSSVKAIRVSVHSASTVAHIKRLTITRIGGYDNNRPLHTYSGLNHDMFARKASADPSGGIIGAYEIGEIILNAAAASAAASYWQCTTAGRLAAAWTNSTAYVAGQLVLNDTNKIYECVTAGTSAGSGGPTGPGTGISDNTAVWDYLSPKAVFTAGPSLL